MLARGAVTLVVAPPGSGKTVLVASWAAQAALSGPAVWVTADGGGSPLVEAIEGLTGGRVLPRT